MRRSRADVVREYRPFPVEKVAGVTHDGSSAWFAAVDKLHAVDRERGEIVRSLDVAAQAGTAFDGRHLYQIADHRIHKIDPATGRVLSTIPSPGGKDSGLAWAEGSLWVGQYRERTIHEIDPHTGAILRTIESNRFVTGVTWVDAEAIGMPAGLHVSGLESDGGEAFFCGGATSGKVRVVRRPRRG